MFDLTGHVAVVTGAASGIGLAQTAASSCRAEGAAAFTARPCQTSRTREGLARRVAGLLPSFPGIVRCEPRGAP
jgi:NAD(P)-dependent dehydrogenase (short-subunit alcohol dehydrogenase family)